MNVEYTPTTDDVRAYYVWAKSRRVSRERGAEFDRWLAAHDAEVAAVARQTAEAEFAQLRDDNVRLRRGR